MRVDEEGRATYSDCGRADGPRHAGRTCRPYVSLLETGQFLSVRAEPGRSPRADRAGSTVGAVKSGRLSLSALAARLGSRAQPRGAAASRLNADWSDGHHELALELGEPDDDGIDRAMAALDNVPELDGWSRSRDPRNRRADRLPARLSSLDGRGQMYGVATLSQGPRTVCVASALREGDGAGPDWLKLGFPMGALVRVLAEVGVYPYQTDRWDPSVPWRRALDDWLADVGRTVYATAPFRLGLIGFEVGGLLPLDPAYRDPAAARPVGLLVPAADCLTYLPASE